MSSFNQGVPTVPTLINSSNCIVLGNTSSGTALTVQQLGAGAVMNVATSTGSSALFVSSTGQVGVGTTSPAYALDVYTGTMNAATVVATTLTGAGSGITALNMGNAGSGTLAVARGGTGTTTSTGTGSVVLSASPALSGTATFAAITTSGNVGIGYYSPQSILHVQVGDVVPTASGNMATGMIISQASYGPAMCLGARTTGGNYTWIHSAYTNNSGVAAPLVLQPIGGNVGIGTTNPGPMLDIWATGTTFQTSGSLRFYRSDAGSFWKFTGPDTGNSLYLLNAGGVGVSITNGSTSWAAASDSRIKNIIEPISNALSKVELLNPVLYSWKNDETNEPHPGLIAQDVLKVQPEAVSSDKDGMYGVRYTELVPLAFAAIKEISAKNAALEARLAALEQSLATATANNSSLESKLAA